MLTQKPEAKRRRLDKKFDNSPSIHHRFNFDFFKKYIKGKKVLDVGCWTGQFEKLAAKHTKSTIGIDPGKEAVEYAKKNVKEAKFRVGDALDLKFKSKSFDAVVFIEVIEHLPKKTEQKALKEINRVLKKGGYLLISTPNNHLLSILFDPAYFLIGHRHYSLNQIVNLLEKSGFEVIKKFQTGGILRLSTTFIDTIAKHLFSIKLRYPKWIKEKVKKEYYEGGFATNHIIAKKTTDFSA